MSNAMMLRLANLANRLDANGMRIQADAVDSVLASMSRGDPEGSVELLEVLAGIDKTAGIWDYMKAKSPEEYYVGEANRLIEQILESATSPRRLYSQPVRDMAKALEKALGQIPIKYEDGMGTVLKSKDMQGLMQSINNAIRGQPRNPQEAMEAIQVATSGIKEFVQDPVEYEEKKEEQEELDRMAGDPSLAEWPEEKQWRAEEEEARRQQEEAQKLALKPSEEAEAQIADWLSQGFKEERIAKDFEFKKTPIDLEQSVAVQQHRKIDKKLEEHAETVRAYLGMNPDVMEQLEENGWSADDYLAWQVSKQTDGMFDMAQVMSMMEAKGLVEEEEELEVPEDSEPAAVEPAIPEPATPAEPDDAAPRAVPVDLESVTGPAELAEPAPAVDPIEFEEGLELLPLDIPVIAASPRLQNAIKLLLLGGPGRFAKEMEAIDRPSKPQGYTRDELLSELEQLAAHGLIMKSEPEEDPSESAEFGMQMLEAMDKGRAPDRKVLKYTEPAKDYVGEEAQEQEARRAQESVGVSQQTPVPEPEPIADKPVAKSVEKPENPWVAKMIKERVQRQIGASRGTLLIPMPENW